MKIYTIGHSNQDFESFAGALESFKIKKLIDVRSLPGSRYVPQFNREELAPALEKRKISYEHFPLLGGRRKSGNKSDYVLMGGWKNASFRNYAAYTLTSEYGEGIERLISEGKRRAVCIMCAESVPWRCHRLLISNTLVNMGIEVIHIMGENKHLAHELNKYGAKTKIIGGQVVYPEQTD